MRLPCLVFHLGSSQVISSHSLIEFQKFSPVDLRYPAPIGPAKHVHLKEPVLSRGISKAIEESLHVLSKDVGDTIIVPINRDVGGCGKRIGTEMTKDYAYHEKRKNPSSHKKYLPARIIACYPVS